MLCSVGVLYDCEERFSLSLFLQVFWVAKNNIT